MVPFFILDSSMEGLEARIPPTDQGGKAVHGRTASGIRGEVTQGETRRFTRRDRVLLGEPFRREKSGKRLPFCLPGKREIKPLCLS